MFKRIISFVLVIAIVFCFAVPSAFAITEYRSKATNIFDMWFTYLYNNADDVWDENSPLPLFGTAIKGITTALNSKICQESHDGYHASLAKFVPDEAFGIDDDGRYALLICEYCGDYFRCYSSDLIAAHDEYVSSLDSSTANSSIAVTGFSVDSTYTTGSTQPLATSYTWAIMNGDFAAGIEMIQSLGILDKVAVLHISDTTFLGLFWDKSGRLCGGQFVNPFGSTNLDYFGVYSFSDLELVAYSYERTRYNTDKSTEGYIFYSQDYALVSEYTSSYCYVFDLSSSSDINAHSFCKAYYKSSSSRYFTSDSIYSYWYDSVISDESAAQGYSNVYVHGPVARSMIFDNSYIIVQPTGVDTTSRTGSLMQTINNYNVDNSVVDNSSNVNYYISPKSYVTELPDDTIDIEQCYSPQSYDEETLVFTEPVTGAQILSSGWIYNYETRTYDIAVPAGTTTDTLGSDITRIELIYGDYAVTYNYYLADDTLAQSDEYAYVMVSGDENFGTGGSSGDDNTGDDSTGDTEEETHKHSYTDTVTTEPTCEAPGIRKYTCDECGGSYTEKIDAAGHTWTVKQTVATQYDDTGAVTVQGYTIYKCLVCNTEYKDDAGTGPPNNSADNTDGEGIFKKIGQLLGSILSGLLGMIEAVLGGLLDGLVRLANLLGDKLTQVVEIVTGLFDKIPQLFGGFTALLADVFLFIPEDIMTIFTFGAAAIVFVGILMFFIKR